MSFQNQDQPDSSHQRERVCIGRIASAHGVKGLVKILPFGEDPALLEQVSDFRIKLKNSLGKHILAEIEGVHDRTGAEELKGTDLYISRDQLPEIEDEDTFYYQDLVGLPTVDEDGNPNGKVKAVLNFGAGELLEVRMSNGEEILIPFTDEYVPVVADTITIRNYEGLLL